MKVILLTTAILAVSWAKPNGYYHQEYNYKASSQSYHNNELQHSKDDSGHFSKDGDLEGRTKPKIRQHDQHSEYVNPKLKNDNYASYGYNNGYGIGQTSSYGQLNANGYGSNYGSRSLNQIAHSLENQLANELQMAISQYRTAASYSSSSNMQMQNYLRQLEDQLRHNISMQMQDALRTQFGEQGIRNQMSYSIVDGHLQFNANYNNQELENVIARLQSNLVQQLHVQFEAVSKNNIRPSASPVIQYHTTPRYQPAITEPCCYPVTPVPYFTERPQSYHQQPSVTTIATGIQNDLNAQMDRLLKNLQHRYFQSNRQLSTYELENILVELKQEVKNNVSMKFNEEMRRNYGNTPNYNQDYEMYKKTIEHNLINKLETDFNQKKNDYIRRKTNAPIVQHYPHQNIQIDIMNMQKQLEIELTRQIQAAITQQSNTFAYNPQVDYQNTLQQLRQELNANLTRQMEQFLAQQYGYGYSANNAMIANLKNQLKGSLEQQLSQGLQHSFSRYSSWGGSRFSRHEQYGVSGQYSTGQFGTTGSGQSGNSFNLLKDDCCTMMADAPQQARAKRSFSYNSYGSYQRPAYSSYNSENSYSSYRARMHEMNQHRDDVQRVVDDLQNIEDLDETEQEPIEIEQEPIEQKPTDDFDLVQQKQVNEFSQLQIGSQRKQIGQDIDDSDLVQQKQEAGYGQLQVGSHNIQQKPTNVGQELDSQQEIGHSDLVQQKIENDFGKLTIGSQSVEQKPIYQETEEIFQKQEPINLNQNLISQQKTDPSDDTQQKIEDNFGQLTIGSHNLVDYVQTQQKIEPLRIESQQIEQKPYNEQEIDDLEQEPISEDLTQQKIEDNFGKLTVGSHKIEQKPIDQENEEISQKQEPINLNQNLITHQKIDHSDDTQQKIEDNFGQLTVGGHNIPQKSYNDQEIVDSQLTQQQVDDFGGLVLGSHKIEQKSIEDLTQLKIEDNFGQLTMGKQQIEQKPHSEQQSEESHLTQQKIEDNFSQLTIGSHKIEQKPISNQRIDEYGQTQQKIEPLLSGKLQKPFNAQEVDDNFGQLTVGSHKTEQHETQQKIEKINQELLNLGQKPIGLGQKPVKLQHIDDSSETQQKIEGFGTLQVGIQKQEEIERKSKELNELKYTMEQHYNQQQRHLNPYDTWSQREEEMTKYVKLRALIQEMEEDLAQLRKIHHQRQGGTYFDFENIQKATTPRNYHYYPAYGQNAHGTGQVEVVPDNRKKSVMSQKDLSEATRQSQILIERIRERLRKNQESKNDGQQIIPEPTSYKPVTSYGSSQEQDGQHVIPEHPASSFTPYGSTYGNQYHSRVGQQEGHSYHYHHRHNSYGSGSHYHSRQDEYIPSETQSQYSQRPEKIQDFIDRSEEANEQFLGVKGAPIVQNTEKIDDSVEVFSTTEQPGFWRRIGSKIRNSVG